MLDYSARQQQQSALVTLSSRSGAEEQPRSPHTPPGLQSLEGLKRDTAQLKTDPSQMFHDPISVMQRISNCPKTFFRVYKQIKSNPAQSCIGVTQSFDSSCPIFNGALLPLFLLSRSLV